MATYAADKLSFWVNGVEVAYLSNSELVVTRIIVSDSIQLGNWDIAVNAADGMTVQKRIGSELDLSENNTFTITADKINAIAKDIDLSANTSIKLTADQVNAVANQINLRGNETIEMIVGRVDENAESLEQRVRIDENGLHVGNKANLGNEVLIGSGSVNIVTPGTMESSFTGSYIRFGNYQLRKTADGGLAFMIKEE